MDKQSQREHILPLPVIHFSERQSKHGRVEKVVTFSSEHGSFDLKQHLKKEKVALGQVMWRLTEQINETIGENKNKGLLGLDEVTKHDILMFTLQCLVQIPVDSHIFVQCPVKNKRVCEYCDVVVGDPMRFMMRLFERIKADHGGGQHTPSKSIDCMQLEKKSSLWCWYTKLRKYTLLEFREEYAMNDVLVCKRQKQVHDPIFGEFHTSKRKQCTKMDKLEVNKEWCVCAASGTMNADFEVIDATPVSESHGVFKTVPVLNKIYTFTPEINTTDNNDTSGVGRNDEVLENEHVPTDEAFPITCDLRNDTQQAVEDELLDDELLDDELLDDELLDGELLEDYVGTKSDDLIDSDDVDMLYELLSD